MKYSLLIAEDHPLTRDTLLHQTKKIPSIKSVNAVTNGKEAVNFAIKEKPDIILMDIDMPVMNGIRAVLEIKKINPKIVIIMLTAHSEREKVLDAFKSGANGYCVKSIKIPELSKIIDTVIDGGIWIDTKIAEYVFDIFKDANEEQKREKLKIKDFNISEREKEILKYIANGYSNDDIASAFFISRIDVKNHVASIVSKLSVKDRTQAAVFALKNNMIS